MFRWWHTVHHHLGKITFPDTRPGQELDTYLDTRPGQELDTEPDTALAAACLVVVAVVTAAGQGSGAQCQDQGPGIRERVRECCSMGDEAHQEYTGISRLIRARDQRESERVLQHG